MNLLAKIRKELIKIMEIANCSIFKEATIFKETEKRNSHSLYI